MKEAVDHIAYMFDQLRITRRIGFYFTLWLTWYSVSYCIEFAHKAIEAGSTSLDIAAVIAAILVPVTSLQGVAFNFHHKGHVDVGFR